MPNPVYEQNKKPFVYDESMHDYSQDKPLWQEIEPGHFVLANRGEAEGYLERLARCDVPLPVPARQISRPVFLSCRLGYVIHVDSDVMFTRNNDPCDILRRRYMMKRRSLFRAALALMLALTVFGARAAQTAPEVQQREQSLMLEGQLTNYLASQFLKEGQFSLWFDAADFDALPTDTGVKLMLKLNLLPGEVSLEAAQAGQPGAAADQLLGVTETALKEDNWDTTPRIPGCLLLTSNLSQAFMLSRKAM